MIIFFSLIMIYCFITFYFSSHFYLHTKINEMDVSLKAFKAADEIALKYEKAYQLEISDRDGDAETITGVEAGITYAGKQQIAKIYRKQNAFLWIKGIWKQHTYEIKDLYEYDPMKLDQRIQSLRCINRAMMPPKNVSFQYSNGSYSIISEVMGNKLLPDKLEEAVRNSITRGGLQLNLEEAECYEKPRFIRNSEKTQQTQKLLNQYVSTKIIYNFGTQKEILDGNIIHEWLRVDDDLEVALDQDAVKHYVYTLSKKYDTVGITRKFKASTGKIVEVHGGLYGWKIDRIEETNTLLQDIQRGQVLEKEPVYLQKALARGEDEIGNSYVEINITRQHLWCYKDGKLITQGPVVTGNPNRGNATVVGTYMLNYKQKDAELVGPNYESKVTYWMPFFGNIGLHDASWRYSFGGKIYLRNGSHGCINAPKFLAEIVFENIEAGTPIICYEEEDNTKK